MSASRESKPIKSFQSIDDYVFNHFLMPALVKVENDLVKVDEEKSVPFDQKSLATKAGTLKNFVYIYLNSKNENSEAEVEKGKAKSARRINTPHPIGNNSATQGIVFDQMAKIIGTKIRMDMYKGKKRPQKGAFFDVEKYDADYEGKKIVKIANELIALVTESEVPLDAITVAKVSKLALKAAKEPKDANLDELFDALLDGFLKFGIRKKVIAADRQPVANNTNIGYLKGENTGYVGHTWHGGADMDGDLNADVAKIFKEVADINIEEKNLFQIFQKVKSAKSKETKHKYQTRMSCVMPDKKGVVGLPAQLEAILNAQNVDIKDATDLMGQKFSGHYKAFKNLLEKKDYSPGKAGSDIAVNYQLNTILAIALPAFVPSEGMVLSDFPTPEQGGEKILAQLNFVKKAVGRFLYEKTHEKGYEGEKYTKKDVDQVFMPLCEESATIKAFQDTLAQFQAKIKNELKNINKNKKISGSDKKQAYKAILSNFISEFNGVQYFTAGTFSGPSDLTKNMGQISILELTKSYVESELNFRKFMKEVASITGDKEFSSVKYMQSYGKGTSPRRGGNYVLFNIPRTIQGLQMASMSRTIQKAYEKGQDLCTLPDGALEKIRKDIKNLEKTGFIQVKEVLKGKEDKVTTQGSEGAHQKFFRERANGGSKGIIVEQMDKLFKNNNALFDPTKKLYTNNRGMRGTGPGKKAGDLRKEETLKTEEDTRAIDSATKNAYTGLISVCGFPFAPSKELNNNFKLKDFIKSPFGLQVFIAELAQFASLDYKRAEMLGFKADTIEPVKEYVRNVCKFFVNQLGVEHFKEASLETPEGMERSIGRIIGKALEKIDNPVMKKRLQLFQLQASLMSDISKNLTESVERMSKNNDFKTYKDALSKGRKVGGDLKEQMVNMFFAPIAAILNDLANFQLPVVPAYVPEKLPPTLAYKSEPWESFVAESAQAAVASEKKR